MRGGRIDDRAHERRVDLPRAHEAGAVGWQGTMRQAAAKLTWYEPRTGAKAENEPHEPKGASTSR